MGSREKLLDSACASFGQKGYHASSVDDILEAAGVVPSNFYYHFKSKEALGFEVLECIFERARSRFTPLLEDPSRPAAARLEQLFGLFVKRMADSGCCGGCPMGNLAQELSDSYPAFREQLAGFFEECMKGIEAVLQQGVCSGEFRQDLDPRSTAILLFGAIEGLMLLSKSLKDVAPMEMGFRQGMALLMNKDNG